MDKLAIKIGRILPPLVLSIFLLLVATEDFRMAAPLLLLLFMWVHRRFVIPRFALVLFAASFLCKLLVVFALPTPPASDFQVLLDASKQAATGDFSFQSLAYFQRWAYQTGFVLFQSALYFFTGSAAAIKLVYSLFAAGSNLLLYLIARDLFGDRPARVSALLFMLAPFPATFVSVLTNQHASLFFMLFSLYFLIGKRFKTVNPFARCAVAGAGLFAGNLLRPEGAVFAAGIAVFLFLDFLSDRNKPARRRVLPFCGKLACLVGPYLLAGALASSVLSVSGVGPNGLANADPYWKFVSGLNRETLGTYAQKDLDEIARLEQSEGVSRSEAEKRIIVARLTENKRELPLFFYRKTLKMWSATPLSSSFSYLESENPAFRPWYEKLKDFDRGMFAVFLLTAFLSALLMLGENKTSSGFPPAAAVVLILCAYFIVYLLIEAQPRYTYAPLSLIAILSAGGVKALYNMRLIPNTKESRR